LSGYFPENIFSCDKCRQRALPDPEIGRVSSGRKGDFLQNLFQNEVKKMELFEIRQELEKTAKRLADFRGSL